MIKTDKKIYDLAVIGGGASGLVAAISQKRKYPENKVLILEKLDRVGKKILVTGSGRCNIENLNAVPADYNNPAFTKDVFEKYGVKSNLEFWKSLGLMTYDDGSGRLYPRSNTATSVLDCLRNECLRFGIETICSYSVESVKKTDIFIINKNILSKNIIISTGGKASPSQGSDGSGYPILKSLGHHITSLRPSLVQITTDNEFTKPLKGLHAQAHLSVCKNGYVFGESRGEILFTDYGISGIAGLDLSMYIARMSENEKENAYIEIDLAEETDKNELESYIENRIAMYPIITCDYLLIGLVPKRVGQIVLKKSGVSISKHLNELSKSEIKKIAKTLKCFSLKLKGTKGFDSANVTSGGVDTNEFDSKTLMSKKVKGLYCCGEVLDIDSVCGGYHLHWAWSSGRLAGETKGRINDKN